MEQGAGVLLRWQVRQQIHHAGEDRQAGPPAVALVAGAEFQPDAEGLARVGAAFDERNGGLGNDQREVLLQAVAQAAAVVGQFVAVAAQINPDVAVDHGRWERRHVVGPQVEGAAGRHVEARVMPVAGEDAVVDAAAIQGEAHVGAAVIQGVNAVAVADEHQGAVARAHSVAGSGGEIAQTPGVGESISGHGRISSRAVPDSAVQEHGCQRPFWQVEVHLAGSTGTDRRLAGGFVVYLGVPRGLPAGVLLCLVGARGCGKHEARP